MMTWLIANNGFESPMFFDSKSYYWWSWRKTMTEATKYESIASARAMIDRIAQFYGSALSIVSEHSLLLGENKVEDVDN